MAGSFADIVTYFEREHEGYFQIDEENQRISQSIRGDNASYKIRVGWNEELEKIYFWVRHIMTIPESKRLVACTLINLINWKLSIGNFEMDMQDGELMVNHAFIVADGTLGHKQIDTHFNIGVEIADHYYPAFQKLIWADASPEEALASIGK